MDEILKQITTYAETLAKAQGCRALAGPRTSPADRDNMLARADFWTTEAAGQLAAITETLTTEVASTLYAVPDSFAAVRLPAGLRHIEIRGVLGSDRTVTITFDLIQAVNAAALMLALAGIGNDRSGNPIDAILASVPPIGTA